MLTKRVILFLAELLFLFYYSQIYALDRKITDISASVEVLPTFSISLDNPHLAFGLVKPGQTKILGEGRFFNQIKCRSNYGRDWYLKAQLTSLRLLGKPYSLPTSNLKYRIVESTGSAEVLSREGFKEFTEQPSVIYTSQSDDNEGKEVILRFQYSLTSPSDAPAGNYIGRIIFTMTESP